MSKANKCEVGGSRTVGECVGGLLRQEEVEVLAYGAAMLRTVIRCWRNKSQWVSPKATARWLVALGLKV